MTNIRFANIIFGSGERAVAYPQMYCRSEFAYVSGENEYEATLTAAGRYDFNTYFNSLSIGKLREYTHISGAALHLEYKGAAFTVSENFGGIFDTESRTTSDDAIEVSESSEWSTAVVPLSIDESMMVLGFELQTSGALQIRNSYYEVSTSQEPNDIELALATTTFKKEEFIIRNVNSVRKNILEGSDDLSQHFHMYVMDNGQTLDYKEMSHDGVTVIPNENVGGAGGFTRGMITAMTSSPKGTHVILMDDDVAIFPESIRRTYNLLRVLKEEYKEYSISGSMMNYEISEDQSEDLGFVSDQGTYVPCKRPLRMTIFEDIIYNEAWKPTKRQQETMYAGWWYCCIPVSVIEKSGLPLPVFVRGDDAEYGIRTGSKFITMNGICVWHMPFHIRYNAAVYCYQVVRNSMVLQYTTGAAENCDFMAETTAHFKKQLKKFNYADAELCLQGLEDFFKGPEYYSGKGVSQQTFMQANKVKEKLYKFAELQEQMDADPTFEGLQISDIDRDHIDGDKPRSLPQRLVDFVTDNYQRYVQRDGEGFAVVPLTGWSYPAGIIRGKKKLLVIDWYNRQGVIREKDAERYQAIMKRWNRDLKYLKTHSAELHEKYAQSRSTITSVNFWREYLDL